MRWARTRLAAGREWTRTRAGGRSALLRPSRAGGEERFAGFEEPQAARGRPNGGMNSLPADAVPEPAPALRRSRLAVSLVVVATFLAVNAIGLHPFRALAGDLQGWPRMLALAGLGYGLYLLAPLAVAAWLAGPRRALPVLGLSASPWPALGLALGCSAIVLAGLAATSTPLPADRLALELVRSALLPGIAEELLFRAFLFGFLFRFAGWGFLPAALLSSLVFGLEHVWQGGDPVEAAGIALLTGVGGLWWSWLLVEWRWNLWVPIAFHVLLNGYWTAFDAADNALGSGMSVALRLGCMLLSIIVTLALARRRGGRRLTGRRWLRGPARAQA